MKYKRFHKILILSFVFRLLMDFASPYLTFAKTSNPFAFKIPKFKKYETYFPAMIKGLKLRADDPLSFDVIVDQGDSDLDKEALKEEVNKMVRYFLASITVPEDNQWVNLSTYESDRIIADKLDETELGRDLLEQDYLLKQMTSSLLNPNEPAGIKFWDRIHKRVYKEFNLTELPVQSFHKVWIVPKKAVVVEHDSVVFIKESELDVMLENDYVAMVNQKAIAESRAPARDLALKNNIEFDDDVKELNELSSQILKEVILPELKREVNQGKSFSDLRQMVNTMILAAWYKEKLKDSIIAKKFANKNRIAGIDKVSDKVKDRVFSKYVNAFKKGAFHFIKEDYDPFTETVVPKKYFSGGFVNNASSILKTETVPQNIFGAISPVRGDDFGMFRYNLNIKRVEQNEVMRHPFRFPNYIWREINYQLGIHNIELSDYLKEHGLAWSDREGIHWFDASADFIEKFNDADAELVRQAVIQGINHANRWNEDNEHYINNFDDVRKVVEFHEELHQRFAEPEYQEIVQIFKMKLDGLFKKDVLYPIPFDSRHPFFETFQKVYGDIELLEKSARDQNYVDWYLEELLVLHYQDREKFNEKEAMVHKLSKARVELGAAYSGRLQTIFDEMYELIDELERPILKLHAEEEVVVAAAIEAMNDDENAVVVGVLSSDDEAQLGGIDLDADNVELTVEHRSSSGKPFAMDLSGISWNSFKGFEPVMVSVDSIPTLAPLIK